MASVAFTVLAALPSYGAVVLSDTFTYANGNLAGTGSWTAHSGAGNIPVQVASNAITLTQGAGSREDVNKALSATITTGQVFYAGFDLTVNDGSTEVYFAHFMYNNTGFTSRLFVTTPTTAGFQLGISANASSADVKSGTDLAFGTTYRVVQSYNFDTGAAQLWVNPTTIASPSVTSTSLDPSRAVGQFGFRQAAGNSTQLIDNLQVATTFGEAAAIPEPSSALLGAMGALALLRRRR